MNIIEPSNSPWGSPCILVRKPLENGKPQPPCFESIAQHCQISDGLLFYHDEFMLTKSPGVFVSDNTNLKQRLPHSYHNSLLSLHHGRDATYSAISRDFYWQNLAKDVRRWVNRCTECIKYKTLTRKQSPMNIRMYLYPFYMLGIDFIKLLPTSSSGNKCILTAVCPFSNFVISVPVPDKTATTTTRALLDNIFCKFEFSTVI